MEGLRQGKVFVQYRTKKLYELSFKQYFMNKLFRILSNGVESGEWSETATKSVSRLKIKIIYQRSAYSLEAAN